MKNRKAAISIEMIVYIAIAVFVLVLVIGFATGAFKKLIPGITRDEVTEAYDNCKIDCSNAETNIQTDGVSALESSKYCTKTYPIKVGTETQITKCWEDPISKTCTIYTQVAGKTWSCSTADTMLPSCMPCAEAVNPA